MAKVKNQIYDGSEECYTDASNLFYSIGEFFRHAMTDAYPLPSVIPASVVRKSPRGYRPSQQGRGSKDQAWHRDCFQQCTDRWNSLPDVCPPCAPCIGLSSKKNAWDSKQSAGVLSSYFDFYLGCCLETCTEISITDAEGITFSGGTISATENCNPCEPKCADATLSIALTSQVMPCSSSQSLHAVYTAPCNAAFCCPDGDFAWELIAGDGGIYPATGPTTTYYSPDSNVNCEDNPTIRLKDCCNHFAYINIAVNCYADPFPAYESIWIQITPEDIPYTDCRVTRSLGICNCYCHYYGQYDCTGEFRNVVIRGYSVEIGPCAADDPSIGSGCTCGPCPETLDIRTADAKTLGCCPPVFL